jgi:hypothetical protein
MAYILMYPDFIAVMTMIAPGRREKTKAVVPILGSELINTRLEDGIIVPRILIGLFSDICRGTFVSVLRFLFLLI